MRLAALVALVGSIVLVAVVVASSLDGGRNGGGKQKREAASGCKPEYENAVKDGSYIVQEGDLMFLIAERTCVDDDELARLNPDIDPQALTPGQCVNLVERGCDKRES